MGASNFYILILGYLQDMTQSLTYITKVSHKHVHNNHKKLKFNQIKELSQINDSIQQLFSEAIDTFNSQSFEKIGSIIEQKSKIMVGIIDDKMVSVPLSDAIKGGQELDKDLVRVCDIISI